MNIVIDTNILIGSTWDEFSHSKRIIDEVIAGNITAYATQPVMRENKLLLEKAVPHERQKKFLEDYFARIIEVPITTHHRIIEQDPEDDKFINAALSAGAEYIITNDEHLLAHDGFEGLKIRIPHDFWNIYEQEHKDNEQGTSNGAQWMLNLMDK